MAKNELEVQILSRPWLKLPFLIIGYDYILHKVFQYVSDTIMKNVDVMVDMIWCQVPVQYTKAIHWVVTFVILDIAHNSPVDWSDK